MLINDQEQFLKATFETEAEIELVVQKYAEQLFGPNIIYLPQTKVSTLGGKGTVPDAIVIDVEGEEWYIVEAERAVHGTWEHIAPQVSKQLAAMSFPDTRQVVLQLALAQIAQNRALLQVFSELGIAELGIHGRLHKILQKPVTIAIPIDAIPKDLTDWIQTLKNTAKIWVLEKYVSVSNPDHVLYSLPDENRPTIATDSSATGGITPVKTSSSQPYQDVMDAGLLVEGQELFMDYGPRGMPRQKFVAVVRKDGLEVDGKTYSPSYAAVACMNKAGSTRKTANGWVHWKTADGEYLDDLFRKIGMDDHDLVSSLLPPEGTIAAEPLP